jgi:hypothetical protein
LVPITIFFHDCKFPAMRRRIIYDSERCVRHMKVIWLDWACLLLRRIQTVLKQGDLHSHIRTHLATLTFYSQPVPVYTIKCNKRPEFCYTFWSLWKTQTCFYVDVCSMCDFYGTVWSFIALVIDEWNLLNATNKMQRYTVFFIIVNALQACLLLPLAVAASKPGTYQMLCLQFLSSWWWAEKLPETCRALTIIRNIV